MAVADAKHWFWWLNNEQRAVVKERKAYESKAVRELASLEKQRASLLSDAKAELGLWSEVCTCLHTPPQLQQRSKTK